MIRKAIYVTTALAYGASAVQAQSFPSKPVRLITASAAGAAADGITRTVAAKMSELWGQQVIVDNRSGAGNTIAPAIAAKAAPDGYTLFGCGLTDTIAPALHRNLPYDLLRDFAGISLFGATPNVLVVHPSVPAKSVQEMVAYAKANPRKVDYASTGVGAPAHLTMELFKIRTGIDLQHVLYKGGPLLIADLVAGRVSAMMSILPAQVENVRSGKLRALAVTTLKRSPRLPDVPTVAESGVPGFDVTVWYGLCVPAVVAKSAKANIHAVMVKALNFADVSTRFEQLGVERQPLSTDEFDAFIRSELAKWKKVVQDAGIPAQ
jgi:tripartite-type tricarboxylate transporter receptor subunit TctC